MQSNNVNNDSSGENKSSVITALYAERLADLKSSALIASGKAMLDNQLWNAGGYYQPVNLTLPMDWTIDPFKDRTWKWFLHQFEFAKGLLAYDLAHDVQSGFELLKEYVQSWADSYLNDLSDTDSAWHDHGTALRARNLLLLLAYMQCRNMDNSQFFSELTNILSKHIQVLLEDSFYSKGTNHGLDQNIVLFELLKELQGKVMIDGAIEKASARVNYEISKAFAADGGHIENSAAYLTFGLKQAVDALHIGYAYDGKNSLIKMPIGMLERATTALTHTTRPDGKLPLIGDTCDYRVRDIFRDMKPDNYQQFLYSINKGARGTIPESTDLVLTESGWAIFRSTWEADEHNEFTNQLHCVFKCGFLSNYHRHDDDLSFVLFNKGKDWIVEGGLYKHSRTDPYRLYFRSAKAHNISMPFRSKATRMLEDSKETGIVSFERFGNISTVRAHSSMFTGYRSTRELQYNRENNKITITDIIIPISTERERHIDQLLQTKSVTYVTRFLVPEEKTVIFEQRNGICRIKDGNDILSITCIGDLPKFKITVGQTNPDINGWISHRPNKLKPCQVIEFFHYGRTLDMRYELNWN